MAARGQGITVTYVAWDTANNAGKTGDVANHTLRWVKDGTASAPSNSPAEVDATNAPGVYKLALTGTEMTMDCGTLSGKSSTANVVIIPLTVTTEMLPAALVGGRVDASMGAVNDAAGVRSAVGLSAANLDTQLAAIAAYIDAEITTLLADLAAVKAKTDNLAFTVANRVDAQVLGVQSAAANLKKNAAFSAFEFVMTDSTNHNPATGLTVTATRSIDGAAFAACANAVAEVASGVYKIDLAAADLNGNAVTLRFTATGADDRLITVITQP